MRENGIYRILVSCGESSVARSFTGYKCPLPPVPTQCSKDGFLTSYASSLGLLVFLAFPWTFLVIRHHLKHRVILQI